MRAGEIWSGACAIQPLDRFPVERLGDGGVFAHEGRRPRLESEGPLGSSGSRAVHKLLEGGAGAFVFTAAYPCLDELDECPGVRSGGVAVARALRGFHGGFVTSRAVVDESACVVE